jgi:hypothetical protein
MQHHALMNHVGLCTRAHYAHQAKIEYYQMLKYLERTPQGRGMLEESCNELTQRENNGDYPFLPLRTDDL